MCKFRFNNNMMDLFIIHKEKLERTEPLLEQPRVAYTLSE